MDAEKYWREFEHSGKIADYMSYRGDADVRKRNRNEGLLGDGRVERFCACDRHGAEDGKRRGI